MNYLALRYILWVLNILVTCQKNDCIIGKAGNKQLPCCSNYFLDKGECKDCLPGYFGINCSSLCAYPNFGQSCQNTCDCTVTYCHHVLGCQGNPSQTETSTSSWSKYTSSENDYKQTSKINEGSTDLTRLISVVPSSKTSITVDKTNKQSNDNKNDNENLALAIILLVGCVLAILLVVNGLTWILKFIRRKRTNLVNTRDNYTIETVYIEVNAGSDQQESESNTTGATVPTRLCTSLGGVETRPELPARNISNQNPCHADASEDDETYINV